ncbi:MAG: SMP-30/gluconolactonase/LRE family protein [Halobacteriaceae archaeon]
MAPEPSVVADYGNHTGEGPIWHPDEQALYWVDIPVGALFRYDPASGDHAQVYQTDLVGGVTVQADGDLLLFGDRGRVETLDTDTWETETVVKEIEGEEAGRFNDVIAAPDGSVFCGTMPTESDPAETPGTLYRLDPDASLTVVEEEAWLPNGLGFSPDRETMYFTESTGYVINRYAYDEATGELSDREAFVETDPDDGIPDGMTVDGAGDVWSARWNGGRLVRYRPDGTEAGHVEFPAKKVSAVAFGGPEFETAYVTTAMGPGDGFKHSKAEEGAGAGALFEVDLGVAGKPEFYSRVGLD